MSKSILKISIISFDHSVYELWKHKQKKKLQEKKKEQTQADIETRAAQYWDKARCRMWEGNTIQTQRFMAQITAQKEKGAYRGWWKSNDIVLHCEAEMKTI